MEEERVLDEFGLLQKIADMERARDPKRMHATIKENLPGLSHQGLDFVISILFISDGNVRKNLDFFEYLSGWFLNNYDRFEVAASISAAFRLSLVREIIKNIHMERSEP